MDTINFDYFPGDLVWAKMKGFPPWPGKVTQPDELMTSGRTARVWVFFFGSHNFGAVARSGLRPFSDCEPPTSTTRHRWPQNLKEAIKEAESELAALPQDVRERLARMGCAEEKSLVNTAEADTAVKRTRRTRGKRQRSSARSRETSEGSDSTLEAEVTVRRTLRTRGKRQRSYVERSTFRNRETSDESEDSTPVRWRARQDDVDDAGFRQGRLRLSRFRAAPRRTQRFRKARWRSLNEAELAYCSDSDQDPTWSAEDEDKNETPSVLRRTRRGREVHANFQVTSRESSFENQEPQDCQIDLKPLDSPYCSKISLIKPENVFDMDETSHKLDPELFQADIAKLDTSSFLLNSELTILPPRGDSFSLAAPTVTSIHSSPTLMPRIKFSESDAQPNEVETKESGQGKDIFFSSLNYKLKEEAGMFFPLVAIPECDSVAELTTNFETTNSDVVSAAAEESHAACPASGDNKEVAASPPQAALPSPDPCLPSGPKRKFFRSLASERRADLGRKRRSVSTPPPLGDVDSSPHRPGALRKVGLLCSSDQRLSPAWLSIMRAMCTAENTAVVLESSRPDQGEQENQPCKVARSPLDLAAEAPSIILCYFPDRQDELKRLVLDPSKGLIANNMLSSSLVVLSSVSQQLAKRLHQELTQRAWRFLESPLLPPGRGPPARFCLLASGCPILFADLERLLGCGPSGRFRTLFLGPQEPAGRSSQLAVLLQGLQAVCTAALAETVALSKRLGVDEELLMRAARSTELAGPPVPVGPEALSNGSADEIPLDTHQRHLKTLLAMADEVSQPLSVTAAANELFKSATGKRQW